MPSNQSFRLHDRKGVAPIEPSGELHERETNGIGRPARLGFPLNVQAELLAQEQILSRDGGGRRNTDR